MRRQSVQPVTLGRIVETIQLAKRNGGVVVPQDLVNDLGVKVRRAIEILRMTQSFGYLRRAEKQLFAVTGRGEELTAKLSSRDLPGIHELMLEVAPYRELYDAFQRASNPLTKADLLDSLRRSEIVSFNAANLDVLCDWLERLEVLQRNVFDGRMYVVGDPPDDIRPSILDAYRLLNRTSNPLMTRAYVEIPRLRETVCSRIRLDRMDFDRHFLALVRKNLGIIELSGAPLNTRAKRASKRIKNIQLVGEGRLLKPRLSSNPELQGIVINGRTYYYVAFHGGRLSA